MAIKLNPFTGSFDIISDVNSANPGSAASPGIYFVGDPNTGIYSPGADQVAISTGGTGRLFVNANGDVTVGHTSSPYSAAGRGLVSVNGSSSSLLDLQTGTTSRFRMFCNGTTTELVNSEATGNLVFGTNNTERLRITSAGLVGVGTSSPGTNLHIGSGSGQGLGVLLSRGATTNFFEAHDGTKTFIGGTDNTNDFIKVGSFSNHPVAIIQGNGAAIYIDTSKRVGIGTSSPSAALDVRATSFTPSDTGSALLLEDRTTNSQALHFYINNAGVYANSRPSGGIGAVNEAQLRIAGGGIITNNFAVGLTNFTPNSTEAGAISVGGAIRFFTKASLTAGVETDMAASERMRIDSSGRLGIGTTTPTRALDVNGSIQLPSNQALYINGSSNYLYADSSATELGSATKIIFTANGSQRATIDSSGRFGIGTSAPQAQLQVLDRIKISDSTQAQGSLQLGDGASTLFNVGLARWNGSTNAPGAGGLGYFSQGTGNSGGHYFYTGDAAAGSQTARMTIAPGGNVGIGTTSPGYTLDINGPVKITTNGINDSYFGFGANFDNYFSSGVNGVQIFRRYNTESARIDSSGRLLVGTSTASNNLRLDQKFAIASTAIGTNTGMAITQYSGTTSTAAPIIEIQRSRGTSDGSFTEVITDDLLGAITFRGADGAGWSEAANITAWADGDWTTSGDTTDSPGRLVFSTTADGASSPTERMRINNAGDVLFGVTSAGVLVDSSSPAGGGYVGAAKTDDCPVLLKRSGTDGNIVLFAKGGIGNVGGISVTTTATAYNTSSDYRLKENVTAVTDGITRLQQLKPSRFNFITDPDKTVDGFIAHEVQTVVPEAITGEKDAVGDDGNPVYQGIDQSKLVPLLTAALQEAVAKIESLEARLTAAGI